ncbi:MAG: LysM peptidoglycan-binding domain-containing protein [Burkholderiales bacterium]|nr:LysM peptidoglycan-binding domain-containing protein [Burkholderiales bacterium]MCL4689234.1 LysM peptidoglycan-binding domain-containing protein [Burkholderiales bacterium]
MASRTAAFLRDPVRRGVAPGQPRGRDLGQDERSPTPKEGPMADKMPDFSNVQSGSSSTAEKTYVVVSGDSLSKIAKREYGNANDWPRIFEANKDILKDPNKIYPGQKLKIPPK